MKRVKTLSAASNYNDIRFRRIQEDAKILAGQLNAFYRKLSALENVEDYVDIYDTRAIERTIKALEDVSLGVILEKYE